MGRSIGKDEFTPQDFERFAVKVRDNLRALKKLLAAPDFGVGEQTVGAELEFYLVDSNGLPAPCNTRLLEAAGDPALTPELNRYNLEYNLKPHPLAGRPLAQACGAELLPIGILPTLSLQDFGTRMMTDLPRYHAMDRALREMRGGPFEIDIDGTPPLKLSWDDVTLEGANTSYQVHLRVEPGNFSNSFNALQLVTPIALALAANSPTLFGHDLWEETRIALFKQSIDSRAPDKARRKYPSRVYFGTGWIREGILELFESTVALFPAIMPEVSDEDAEAVLGRGGIPHLYELQLHQGSTWPWNRAIFDHRNGGHVRIEARTLPAGPSLIDMNANAAFLIGCVLALRDSMPDRVNLLPFRCAEENFFRVAREGLDAVVLWPSSSRIKMVEYDLTELASRLIPLASEALVAAGVDGDEVAKLMTIIAERLALRTNGARWQRRMANAFAAQGCDRRESLFRMLDEYRRNYRSREPVSRWSTDP